MSAIDTLEEIWNTYKVTKDCFKITERSIDKDVNFLLKRTNFLVSSSEKAKEDIRLSADNADDYVILSLWTVFERRLFEEVKKESEKISKNTPSGFSRKVQKEFESKLEYWRLDDILNLFKDSIIDSDLIGIAKQIKKYRDWVTHKNPTKEQPSNITPVMAYDTLSNIIKNLEEFSEVN